MKVFFKWLEIVVQTIFIITFIYIIFVGGKNTKPFFEINVITCEEQKGTVE